jgi:hypothetical protein
MINDLQQQRKLEELADFFQSSVEEKAYAGLVVGTYAHSRDYNLKQTSDLDIMVLCNHEAIPQILKTPVFEGYSAEVNRALEYMDAGLTDLMSTRHQQKGCLFTVHFMTPEVYSEKFSSSEEKRLFSFRKVRKEYTYQFRNFDGTSIEVQTENFSVEGGFRVPMDTCRLVEGRYYSGSPHNKLMSQPLILFDNLGVVKPSISELRKKLVRQMVMEYGQDIDFDQIALVNTLVRKERVSPKIMAELLRREKEIYKQLRQ